jgi:beta-lactamase regulating signal transducer with metallopeptidase domain
MTAALLDHLWQSSLFAGAIVVSMRLFRRQSASLRFWLWFAASMKFLFPFALLMILGHRILSALAPVATAPILLTIHPAVASIAAIAAPLEAPALTNIPAMDVAAVVWGTGLIAIILHWLSRWLDLHATLKDAVPIAIKAPVPVKSAPSFLEPGLLGIWKPVILVPAGLNQHLTSAEMDAVLAHELCHLRRSDNLLAALHMLVEGLFWFHPLVWWIGNRLCEERERACDESVVAGGVRPLVYAEGILKTCRFYVQSPLACASGVSGADLNLRLSLIIADQPAITLHPAKAMLLALAGMGTLILPLAASILGSAPVTAIATKVATVLAAPDPAMPVIGSISHAPKKVVLRHGRHHIAIASPATFPTRAETPTMLRLPAIQINTVLETRLPSISAPAVAAPQSDSPIVCRRPEQLFNSRLTGPEVCLRAEQWAKLHANGQDISPDGRSVIRTDYEKERAMAGSPCPQHMSIGASTGWQASSIACF